MSHNFKRPSPLDPKLRRQERQLTMLAGTIRNQAALDQLLRGSSPAMREGMLQVLRPMLPFQPQMEVTADCPNCGFRRGSVIGHECTLN